MPTIASCAALGPGAAIRSGSAIGVFRSGFIAHVRLSGSQANDNVPRRPGLVPILWGTMAGLLGTRAATPFVEQQDQAVFPIEAVSWRSQVGRREGSERPAC
jgi:hypothetical protein